VSQLSTISPQGPCRSHALCLKYFLYEEGNENKDEKTMRKSVFLLLTLFLSPLLVCSAINAIQANEPTAPAKAKQGGISGDPARKRGLELGFDKGLKAGKQDKDKGLKPNPKSRDEFNNPDKSYSYEYGSRASFDAGFRSGFLGGYQQGFGQKVKGISVYDETGRPPSSPTPHGPVKPPPKPKSSTVNSDAW
jgi:hypothetical protein